MYALTRPVYRDDCFSPQIFCFFLPSLCHSRAYKAHSFSSHIVCFFPLRLIMITGFAACSLYLCRSLSGAFAPCVLLCLPVGAGWPVASAVGNEPSLTGSTCQQPLCPLGGLSAAARWLGY